MTVLRASGELERDRGQPRDVVDAVPGLPVGDHARGVLDDPDVVDQRPEMIRSDRRELELDDRDRTAPRSRDCGLPQHDGGLGGDRRPRKLGSDPPRLRTSGLEGLRVLDELADRVRHGVGVVEGHELPRTRGEDVLRIQEGRRDRRAPGGDGERQRPRRDLLRVAVRRDEDVGGVQEIGQLVDSEEAVVELDVVVDAETYGASLEQESILLALVSRDLRMRSPRDQVQHLGMALDDRGQRGDCRLDPLAGGDQPERREDEARPEPIEAPRALMSVVDPAREDGRRPVLDDADLVRGARLHLQQEPLRRLRHHDDPLGLCAELGEYLALMIRRLGEHGVERDDQRPVELLCEREDVLAVGAAEDPVFVLQEDDVDVESAKEPCRSDVVAPYRLRDGRDDLGALWAGSLVHDRDRADASHALDGKQ